MLMLPFRICLYTIAMVIFFPILLLVSIFRAIYKRIMWGKVSDVLKYGGRMWPGDVPYDVLDFRYPATFTFTKPFDHEKLKELVFKMAEETKVPTDKTLVWFESESPPEEFNHTGPLEADHYLKTKNTNILKETDLGQFGKACKPCAIAIRLWNGAPGKPTLMHAYLPGGTWDGTSCFNFCKELLHRYYGGSPNEFFMGTKLTLTPEAKEILDKNTSFLGFLCRQPYCLLINLSAIMWQLVSCSPCFGGTGFSPEVTYLNFNVADSAKFAAGAKKKGMKPFSACTYAAVKAYRQVVGEDPYCIVQQSSIQTRHYAPKMDRVLTGDWLIGPLQYIGSRTYGHQEAHKGYEDLLADLDQLRRPALRSLEGKAWGLASGGASLFEFLPAYCDDCRLMSSIFLNNYGIREVTPDSGIHHYNWQAPYRFGFNTINVNGKTSIGIASATLGLKKLEEAREVIHKTFLEEFMS